MRISEFLSEHPCEAPTYTIEQRLIGTKMRPLAIPVGTLHTLLSDFQSELRRVSKLGKGVSPIKNALAHKSSLHFFQTDLAEAFSSIRPERLAGVLLQAAPTLGTYEEVVAFLKRYCFTAYAQGLPQGSPASPVLFELYCQWYIDRPLRELLRGLRKRKLPFVVYTRYVDDITISSRKPLSKYLCSKVRKILRGAGFSMQHQKTHYRSRKDNAVVVTGVRILDGGKVDLSQEFMSAFKQEYERVHQDPERDTARLRGFFNYYVELLNSVTRESQRQSRKGAVTLELLSRVETVLHARAAARKKQESRPHLFPKEWLDTLRERSSLVEYLITIAPRARWRSFGDQIFKTSCPLQGCRIRHNRKSLRVCVATANRFDCYCTRGDIIAAVQKHEGVSFVEACVRIAKKVHLPLPDEYYRRLESAQLDLPLNSS